MRPLTGTSVLDLADEPAVFAARILADLGADVIRVEHPSGGRVRGLAPFLNDEPGVERSYYHLYHNANKRSVALDIESEPGRESLKLLAARSDVLLETQQPGRMAELGLGYEELSKLNPGLIHVSVTPHGQDGPWKDRNGNDLTAAASSGLMFVAGQTYDPPTVAGGDQSFKMASFAAASGVMIALYGRRSDPEGAGTHISVSVQEAASMAVCQTSNANHFTWRGDIPQRPGMTRGVFECADGGWVTLNVSPDKVRAFLAWVEEEGIETDVVADAILIQTRGTLLLPEMLDLSAQLAARLKREDFMEKAWALDMMSLPVMDFPDLAECEHLEVTDQFFAVWDDPLSASLGFCRSPVDVFAEPISVTRAPLLGEHTEEVFAELGIGMGAPAIPGTEGGDR